ncbi:Phosphopantetheine attachment site [Lentzea waywayandensis]|uniref:Phosphopantetheine attachment site n=1 Tax=Lentzea waywayandensis TaxID=84724 RepID=A0A1I6FGP6_9PSEU|nr:condensation domain-containing protein [Lentzea waywayandensis]SFR29119.1 Phosphopantetheine attachment site [Lentzea waywayandensis]
MTEYTFPLSFQQHRFWYLEQLNPGGAYHLPIVLRLAGELRVDLLREALQRVVDRHEVLRTRYQPDAQVQVVAEQWTVPLSVVEGDLERIRAEALCEPFDLWSAPPLRVVLVRSAPDEHILLMVIHHIACDGWSLGVLGRELSEAYTALHDGREPDLPELPVQYGDYALWQRDRMSGDVLAAGLAHWAAVLVGAPATLELPTARPRPAEPALNGDRVRLAVPDALAERVEQLAQRHGVSVFMVVLAAYATVLTRLSGQDEVVVGTAISGRERPEVADLVGCFIDVVPLRLSTVKSSAEELLAETRRVCLAAYAHQDVPFERVVDHLRPARDPVRPPLFQVMCNGQDTPRHDVTWPGVEVSGEQPEPGVSKYDLTLDVHSRPGGVLLDLEYDRDVFDEPGMAGLLDRIVVVLDWLTDDTRPLFDGPPRPAPEVDRITAPGPRPPAAAAVEPRDALEALVLGHLRDALGDERLGVTDDFFEHGGSSLAAMTALVRIQEDTGQRLGPADLFGEATAARFAERLRDGHDDIDHESEQNR